MENLLFNDDIVLYIQNFFYDYESLLHLKLVSKYLDNLITSFALAKLMLYEKFLTYRFMDMCININCYDDTWDIYEDVYYWGPNGRRYIHFHQDALNKTGIIINKKKYNIYTPYCSECFTNYVLIGDNKNVRHNLIMNKVNVDYL